MIFLGVKYMLILCLITVFSILHIRQDKAYYYYCYYYYSVKAPDAIYAFGKNGWVSRCQENSYSSSSEWLEKAGRTSSHLLAGHNEEWPIISQPQCGRCHWAGTGQATLEAIGSKRSYALKWCKPNDHDALLPLPPWLLTILYDITILIPLLVSKSIANTTTNTFWRIFINDMLTEICISVIFYIITAFLRKSNSVHLY